MFEENKDDILSPEEKVNVMLDVASRQIEVLEAYIANLKEKKKPSLGLRPPGMTDGRSAIDIEKYAEFYKNEQERIKADAKARTSKLIEHVSPGLKEKLSDQIDKWQNRDHMERSEEKDISQSQDYILRLKGRALSRKELETKIDIDSSHPVKKEGLNSAQPLWLTPVSYRLAKDHGIDPTNDRKPPEIEPDRD